MPFAATRDSSKTLNWHEAWPCVRSCYNCLQSDESVVLHKVWVKSHSAMLTIHQGLGKFLQKSFPSVFGPPVLVRALMGKTPYRSASCHNIFSASDTLHSSPPCILIWISYPVNRVNFIKLRHWAHCTFLGCLRKQSSIRCQYWRIQI